jgi:hypothetical protein
MRFSVITASYGIEASWLSDGCGLFHSMRFSMITASYGIEASWLSDGCGLFHSMRFTLLTASYVVLCLPSLVMRPVRNHIANTATRILYISFITRQENHV